jgi:hypothetical protein
MTYQIVDWDKHYENNRTREMKHMAWVPMPNRQDNDGYTELLDHANGASHFGAWCALVEVASRCVTRGTLLRDSGKAHDSISLERITRIPVNVWNEVFPRLLSIGWISNCDTSQEGAPEPQEGAPEPQEGAEIPQDSTPLGNEGKKEQKELYAEGVSMTKPEHSALIAQYGERVVKLAIEKVAAQQIKTDKKYKRPRGAILQWGIRAALEEIKKTGGEMKREAPSAPVCPECKTPLERDHGYWSCKTHGRREDIE